MDPTHRDDFYLFIGTSAFMYEGSAARWASGSSDLGSCMKRIEIDSSGRLAVMACSSTLWSAGSGGFVLKMQDDGNLVLYRSFSPPDSFWDPVWSRY